MTESDENGSPSVLRRYGPLAAIVLSVQLVMAAGLVLMLRPAEPAPIVPGTVNARHAAGAERVRMPFYYSPAALRQILVNPAGTNAQRFMQASVELGLKAYDRGKTPPKDDVTRRFGKDIDAIALLDRYSSKMRSIISDVLAKRRIDEFDRRELIPVQEEIRDRINKEVLSVVFPSRKPGRRVVVVEVLFTEMVIQ